MHLDIIWKIFNYLYILFGIKQPENPKISRYYHHYQRFVILSNTLFSVMCIKTLITSQDTLVLFEVGIQTFNFTMILSMFGNFYKNSSLYWECIEICEDLHDLYVELHPFVEEIWRICKEETTKKFTDVSRKYIETIIIVSVILEPILQSLFNQELTLTYRMSLCSTDNVAIYLFHWFIQSFCSFYVSIGNSIIFGTIYIAMKYFEATINVMKIALQTEQLRSFVEIHVKLIEHQNLLSHIIEKSILLLETLAYGSFMFTWIVVFFKQEMIPIALGILFCVNMPYFFVISMNEMLSDALDELRIAIYAVDWYAMDSSQRKVVLMLQSNWNKKLLRAGDFHVVSYEYLATFFNRVYSYGLYLNYFLCN